MAGQRGMLLLLLCLSCSLSSLVAKKRVLDSSLLAQFGDVPPLSLEAELTELIGWAPSTLKKYLNAIASPTSETGILEQLAGASQAFNALTAPPAAMPGARRAVMAALLLHRLRVGPLESSAAQVAELLVLDIYNQLRRKHAQTKVVQLTHISKTGGTTLCQLAQRNNLIPNPENPGSCLVFQFDDFPRYYNQSAHVPAPGEGCIYWPYRWRQPLVSCEERRQFLMANNITFYANEFAVVDGGKGPSGVDMCDNEFVTLIQVRRPLERIISHIKMGWRQYGEVCMAQRPLFFTNESIRDVNHWRQLMPGPLDNFYIRSLLGESVFFLPLGKITEAHLNQARMLMAKRIDVFTVMERPDRWAQALKFGMGWCDTEDIVCRANSAKHNQGLPSALPLHWAKELQAINELDVRFYQYVTLLSKLDAVMYHVVESALGDTMCVGGINQAGKWEGCKNLELIKKQKEINANTTGHAVALLAAKGGGTLMSSLSNLTNTLSSANAASAATRRSLRSGK